ncbi:MAG: BCCT family transporter [Candidatus Rifleibacteriota bacterium]
MTLKSVRKKILGVEIEAHPVVFPASAILIVLFVLFAAFIPARAQIVFDNLQDWISGNFSWLYIISMSGFLIFSIYLCFSKFGDIRLGKDSDRPEFSKASWFAMLFSAGMGIGMLFYGVVEPMTHFISPVAGEGESLYSARQAMSTTLFHWCLHPWGLYSVVGLSVAYFGFRRNLPLSFRSVFFPLLGKRIYGGLGHAIDTMAVLATLFGLATSLGLGAKQVNAGLQFVFGWPEQSVYVQIALIACITSMAVASLVSGLHAGIKWLSNINMMIAGGLMVFLYVAGPTTHLLNSFVQNTGQYLTDLANRSFWTASYSAGDQTSWFSSWTVFYWGWWIAWSPFVGMFIARISRGRTIREFVSGVLLLPSAVAILWMTAFGNGAIYQEIQSLLISDDEKVSSTHNFSPRSYPVLTLDEETGMALPAKGNFKIAGLGHGEKLVKVKQIKDGVLTTMSGDQAYRENGVLMAKGTTHPFRPSSEDLFMGKFKTQDKDLTLAGFLTNPVTDHASTNKLDTTATAMFAMLQAYPVSWLTAILGTLSVILFFVTSSDSASMVADIIASGGSPNPTTGTRLFWGILEGVLASVLLLAGGLKALQTGAITLGLPFCLIVIGMCISLYHGLNRELNDDIPESQLKHMQS